LGIRDQGLGVRGWWPVPPSEFVRDGRDGGWRLGIRHRKRFICLGFGGISGGRVILQNRFVRYLRPQLLDALEFLHGAPVQALHLGLVAQEQRDAVALASQ
jgi:hypothetical protein